MIFVLHLINVICHIDWFADTEPFLHPWNKSHLIMVYVPFNLLLNLVGNIVLRNFAPVFIGNIVCDLLFVWYICLMLESVWCWSCRMILETFFPLHSSWIVCESVKFCQNDWAQFCQNLSEFTCNNMVLDFLRNYLITVSISLLLFSLFIFFYFYFGLGRLYMYRNLST